MSACEKAFFHLIKPYQAFSAGNLPKLAGCSARKLIQSLALYMSHCKKSWVYLPKQQIPTRMKDSIYKESLCQKTLLLMR